MHTNDTELTRAKMRITNQAQYDNNSIPFNDDHSYSSSSSLKGLGIPMHPISNVEIAKTTKSSENARRYLQIAFAEDLHLYNQPKDTKMFLRSSNRRKNKALRAAIEVDKDYIRYRAKSEKEIESAIIEDIRSPKGRCL